MNKKEIDTIAALATPVGTGGVGVIRISGPQVNEIAKQVLGQLPTVRFATFTNFKDKNNNPIDKGLALYFAAPNSFTGEDVLELQGHGGQLILDKVLQRILELGARLANPGEFSMRAFLNAKIDLTQAEAIADLINASSTQAASSAMRSLQGEFSKKINSIVENLINLRTHIEAAIDFSDEDISIMNRKNILSNISLILDDINSVITEAKPGVILQEGIKVAIIGKPNVGKSSLLNYFCGYECAIVTPIPGTTRDVLREYINFNGIPIHIVDTAGLRESNDLIEQEGIKRAWHEVKQADFILLVTDADDIALTNYQTILSKTIIVRNKIDLINRPPRISKHQSVDTIDLSVKNKVGLDFLKQVLLTKIGYNVSSEGIFIARRRHIEALTKALEHIANAQKHFADDPLEITAEELRQTQIALNEITGEFYTDDLLARIFSEFCIGK